MAQGNQSSHKKTHSPKAGFSICVVGGFWQKPIAIFTFFLLLTLFLYFPTAQSGFVTDVTGGIERIKNQPFSNIIYSFGFPALNQISIFGFYALYHLFGLNGLPWYLVFCGLHAFNGYLSFVLFKKLFGLFSIEKSRQIAFIGALFFIIHPYQSEVLVWRACLNYLFITAFTLLFLINLLTYLQSNKLKQLYYLHGLFLLALFTFELSLIIPLLGIVFCGVWVVFFKNWMDLKPLFIKITIPQLFLIIGYFILNKLLFSQWIGHYGAETHFKFSLGKMTNTLGKYLVKYVFFVRSYTHSYKETIFNFCDNYSWVILSFLFLVSLYFLFYKKQHAKEEVMPLGIKVTHFLNPKGAIFILLFSGFILSLLPVLNLYFYWLQQVENDRYGYLASVFGLMLLVFLLFQLPKLLRYLLLSIYLMSAVFLLVQTNQNWKESAVVFNSLLEDFRWYDKKNVVILNVPDNYNGVYLFRIIGKGSGFKDALATIHQQTIKGDFWEVAQYNMTQPTDGVNVEKISSHQFKITFNQWGNWFWRNGVGVGPTHERSAYKIQFKGQYYLLGLKETLPDVVFIYQVGNHWEEVKAD